MKYGRNQIEGTEIGSAGGSGGSGGLVQALLRALRTSAPKSSEGPIRSELLSVERLEQLGASLAAAQRVAADTRRGRRVDKRLSENARILIETYHTIAKSAAAYQQITPGAEWLLDNFHIVDEQIRDIKRDLPPGFYRMLPKLTNGPLAGYPRVFGIAWALIAHTDSAFDIQTLTRFIQAYQSVQPLTIGELWAFAITLRITLVENLRRLAEEIQAQHAAGHSANALADRILGTDEVGKESAAAILSSLAKVPWSAGFAVELARRLRDSDPEVTPALHWLNDRLAAEATTADEIMRQDFQRQSATDVTVRSVITRMRLLSTINWAEFVESVSPLDAVLRAASDFGAMDFPTRDRYRRAIEELARESGRGEVDVAECAVVAARRGEGGKSGATERERDPGFFLIAQGRRAFETALGCKVPFRTRLFQLNSDLGVMSYVGMIACMTAIILALALLAIALVGVGWQELLVMAIVGVVPASDIAVAIVNCAITRQVGGKVLPGMELRNGVPPDLRTIVVMPTLLCGLPSIKKQIQRLEDHYLSNLEENITFALVSDWRDSATEHDDDDQHFIDEASGGIERLNTRYGLARGGKRFFLLHRKRLWNECEGVWMGWERKRGKLHELNRLLRGATDTTFIHVDGAAPSVPSGVRYVVTLDSDTRLPIGTVRRLIGKMAHPLNRPFFDPQAGLVVQGHGILQPRITPSLPMGSEGSLYERTFSGPNGLDPYALAVSDVYQDLFEEGSFCGKGIYEIDSFEAAVEGQIPENCVLSHDLLEGILARAGLVSDIEVVEEFPSRYAVASARQHRWVRGDWQLLPWIFGFGRGPHDATKTTPIPQMGRWKVLDNLRRSLSAPASLLALLIGWLMPFTSAAVWTVYVVLVIALPPLLPAIVGMVPLRRGVSLRNHLLALRGDFALGLLQSGFLITFLAHQAWIMVDAVGRTLYRLFIRRQHMLEWVTSAQSADDSHFDQRGLFLQIATSLGSAWLVVAMYFVTGDASWPIAAPFLILWVLSPLVAHWASIAPPSSGHLSVKPEDATALRLIARRTWRFFETFVTATDNMLPPDNFQEDPEPVIAHRTSPTNIGLYLLSVSAAHDFGWLGTRGAVERLEATFATMAKMERFRGHFYNWYDTVDLHPLAPKYISSVDSGNLAGHLIAVRNACLEMADGPILNGAWKSGLADALALLREASSPQSGETGPSPAQDRLEKALDAFATVLDSTVSNPLQVAKQLPDLALKAAAIMTYSRVRALERGGAAGAEVTLCTDSLRAGVRENRRNLDLLMPWAGLLPPDLHVGMHQGELLNRMPTLAGLPEHCEAIAGLMRQGATADLAPLFKALAASSDAARSMTDRLFVLADQAKVLFDEMQFGFLYDPSRQLLSIGYSEADGGLDPSFYDLLASEARLTSFIAIAKSDLPAKHWFRMGRTLTPIDGSSGLISWSGSMFEYLMPSLVMRAPETSLLAQTNRLVVWRQKQHGDELGVPWGMSESEYNLRDIEATYQYSSFGVPDLGFKRGLADSTVIAPYASGLAAMIDPASAVLNCDRMARVGALGVHGFYEALDYTRARLPEGASVAIIRAFMAHHQGMTIVGIGNALHGGRMRARFHAEPIVRAAELLLQERMPRDVAVARTPSQYASTSVREAGLAPDTQRHYFSAHSQLPHTNLLSNGRLSLMLTAAGSGYSRWHDIAITRWREDVTCDDWGSYIFLRDTQSLRTWSAGYQPRGIEPDSYDVTFSEDRAEILRSDGTLTTKLEIMVSPEDDAEVRRVTITNHGSQTREIEVTSYAEIALARQADDVAHPAFASLFVETEFVHDFGAILATRRQRSDADPLVWAAHLSVVEGESSGDVQFETDRARFLGRGQSVRAPAAMTDGWPLSNSAGPMLDCVFSLRRTVRIPRGGVVRIAFWTLVGASRDEVLGLADKHQDPGAFDRASTLAWTHAQMNLHYFGIDAVEAGLYQRLASHILYSNPSLRPASDILEKSAGKPSTLWSQGISGDLPIVLVRIGEDGHLDLVRQLLRAQDYWRSKKLSVDLVILNVQAMPQAQDLQTSLESLVRASDSLRQAPLGASVGAVFVLRADRVTPEVRPRLYACARAVLDGDQGSLADQLERVHNLVAPVSPQVWPVKKAVDPALILQRPEMEFSNTLGGFVNDGRDYLTILDGCVYTPAPWLNVVSNPSFGFQVSTEGSGFTWSVNSQQNQLTPWSNDPVRDPSGDTIYLRDEESGEVWTPTALPIRDTSASYSARHGQGFTEFSHDSRGIALKLLQFVPVDDSIKISRLTITNHSERARQLSVTAYVEWVLGPSRPAGAPHIVTWIDPVTGAIFARNPWNDPFGESVAFLDLGGLQTAWTCDRTEFLGRNGAMDRPAALYPGTQLSNRSGAGLDPCGALQTQVALKAGETTDIVVFLGQTANGAQAQVLLSKYRAADLDAVIAVVTRQWDDMLGVVQVKTPDRALDIMLNRWLPYQTLACRVWARSAFYQASGAYGFRDQLQDVMALCISRPDLAREHVLRAAGRQFVEGDVQHWWLPGSGRGIRTRVSDDRSWLAYVTAHYVRVTGDSAVLDEVVPFLEGPVLKDGETDAFFQPTTSTRTASLFDHCALALDKSLATGEHGLPLMGTGDWNDGMGAVGKGGQGESVWLGWFLYAALDAFDGIAETRQDMQRAANWRQSGASLKAALDREAWDGDWYRRAFFDDGSPLGSVANYECRIDSIAQSWAVISGAADPAHANRAMEALDKYLVRLDDKLLLLFTPPFNQPAKNPGYIKGYPPGVRENGGQYTHGALWAALAFALQGDGDKAGELLSMLNPIYHADTPTGVHRYKVEPYVVCADLYSEPPHVGRGGWTWYTGSAGWMYRVTLESLLGFQPEGAKLRLSPCIPRDWPGFGIVYRYRTSRYEIEVTNPHGVCRGILSITVDGEMLASTDTACIPLLDDGATHRVQVVLGAT
jgi:cyclic beta-1,2-glucan synthetase